LRVHEGAHALAVAVRAVTRRFPRSGYTSLKNQMTSAAESISFNIVEGCGADSQKDFARFLEIAIKSAMELENQLKLAKDYGILGKIDWESLSESTIDIRRMLYGLRTRVRATFPSDAARTQQRTTQQQSTQDAKSTSAEEASPITGVPAGRRATKQ
jgi:four helix bundle protein